MKTQSLKICTVTTMSISLKTFLLDQLLFLSNNGFTVSIVCDDDPDFAKVCPKALKYTPIRITRGFDFVTTILGIYKLYRFFKQEQFDIVQYATPKASFISSISGIMAGVPVRLYCQWGIRYTGFTGIPRLIFKFLEKVTCFFSTHIAPDSSGNLDFSVSEGLYKSQKAEVVFRGSANGVNLSQFDLSCRQSWRNRIRFELGINSDSFVFGFVGRITRDKGLFELISAFLELSKANKDTILLLVGPKEINHGLPPEIIQTITRDPRIYFVGMKNNPQEYIAAMDLVVLPSYREGFGVAAIEAQAMGLPVITTDIPGPREAIVNGKTGILVPPADIKALQYAMDYLYNNQEILSLLGNNGYSFIKENFDQKLFWQKVLEHRRRLISNKQ